MSLPRVDVIVVAFGAEPALPACVASVLSSTGVDVRIALVDNGCTRSDLALLTADDRVVLVRSGDNLGFSGGCNAGADALDGEYIALVNSDAWVDAAALSHLVAGLTGDIGLTTACVLLADQPDTVNAAGNPVQFLGVSWAGGYGDSLDKHATATDVASISGAGAAIRRVLWESLEGFDPAYFMYCEDLELSLRVWQRGLRVRYVPEAKVWHHYEFSRNEQKWFYLERNRLLVMLTVFEQRTLALLAPALIAFEIALLLAAVKDQRLRAKLRAYSWLIRHRHQVRTRRHVVQAQRKVGDAAFVPILAGRIETPVARGPAITVANAVLSPYWRVVCRWV